MSRQSSRADTKRATSLAVGEGWPSPPLFLREPDDAGGDRVARYVGADRGQLTQEERERVLAAGKMPAELVEFIRTGKDTPPAAIEALHLTRGAGNVTPLHPDYVLLPAGGWLHVSKLIEIDTGIYRDPEKTALWRRSRPDDGDDNGSDIAPKKLRYTQIKKPSGMPRLIDFELPFGPSDRNPRDEITYRIEWSDRPHIGVIAATGAELHDGSVWDKFGDLGIQKRADIPFYARIVQLQAQGRPELRRILSRHTGWIKWPGRGWEFGLPNGSAITSAGVIESGIANYKFHRNRDWRSFLPPAKAPSEDEIAGLYHDLHDIDRRGRISIMTALSVRGLASSIEPLQTCVLAIGERRSGKTSSVNFARGVIGPCRPGPRGGDPDATFEDTAYSVETLLAPLNDNPALVDDARKKTGYSIAQAGQIIDRGISAIYSHTAWRNRGAKNRPLKAPVITNCTAYFTAETSVRGYIDESRLLRAIVPTYRLGEIDHDLFRSIFASRQKIHTAAGYAVIRALLRALEAGGADRLADEIAKTEEVFEAWIRDALRALDLPCAVEDVDSLAGCYAAPLVGALMTDRVCGGEAAINAIAPYIVPAILEQVRFIGQGGGSGIDREFVGGAIRWLFSHGGYLLNADGKPFGAASSAPDHVLERGYAPDRSVFASAEQSLTRTGDKLAGKWQDGCDCLIASVFLDASRDYARHIGRDFSYDEQTYPATLERLGLLLKQGKRNTAQVRIGNDRPQTLRIRRLPEISADSADSTYYQSNINELCCLRLPPMEGLLSSLAQTGFSIKNQDDTSAVCAVCADLIPSHVYDDTLPTGTARTERTTRTEGTADELIEAPSFPRKQECATSPPARAAEGPKAEQVATDSQKGKGPSTGSGEARRAGAADRATQRLAVIDVGAVHVIDDVSKPARIIAGGPSCARDLLPFAQREGIALPWVMPQWRAAAGLPAEFIRPDDRTWKPYMGLPHPLAGELLSEGWRPKRSPGFLYPYETFVNDDGLEIDIAMAGFGLGMPGLESAAAPLMADTLRLVRQTTRFWPRAHLNAMGNIMLRGLHSGPGTLDLRASQPATDFAPPTRKPNLVIDAIHLRSLTADEIAAALWIHGYDANRQYGTAMASLPLGFGVPTHQTGNIRFDRERAGYWFARVSRAPGLSDGLPHPCRMERGHRPEIGFRWYVTPTLDLAEQRRAEIDITEAWLFPDTHQPLQPLYQRLNEAASALMAAAGLQAPRVKDAPTVTEYVPGAALLALALVKQIPRSAIGNFDARTRRDATTPYDLYRPDWRHFVIAKARANLLRAVYGAGLVPIATETDSIYIVSPHADPAVAAGDLKLSPQGGHFKVKWSAPIAALPRGFRGKRPPSMSDLRALKAAGKETD